MATGFHKSRKKSYTLRTPFVLFPCTAEAEAEAAVFALSFNATDLSALMIRIFQEASYFATKQIYLASNLDSIPVSLLWFHEFFLLFQKLSHWWIFLKIIKIGTVFGLSVWFNFLSNPNKQITIICLKKCDSLHQSFPIPQNSWSLGKFLS